MHAHSARLASFHCNGRPRARAPIMVTIITTNITTKGRANILLNACMRTVLASPLSIAMADPGLVRRLVRPIAHHGYNHHNQYLCQHQKQ